MTSEVEFPTDAEFVKLTWRLVTRLPVIRSLIAAADSPPGSRAAEPAPQ
jgi:hypothetical protein